MSKSTVQPVRRVYSAIHSLNFRAFVIWLATRGVNTMRLFPVCCCWQPIFPGAFVFYYVCQVTLLHLPSCFTTSSAVLHHNSWYFNRVAILV